MTFIRALQLLLAFYLAGFCFGGGCTTGAIATGFVRANKPQVQASDVAFLASQIDEMNDTIAAIGAPEGEGTP